MQIEVFKIGVIIFLAPENVLQAHQTHRALSKERSWAGDRSAFHKLNHLIEDRSKIVGAS